MAIASISPTFTPRSKQNPESAPTKRTDLTLVPSEAVSRGVDPKAFAIFLTSVAIAGLLALLAINTALSQGAFELTKLNMQATALNDQREAVMKKIARASSPEVLAYRAKMAGMVASQSPRFLVVGDSNDVVSPSWFSKVEK